MRALPHPPHQMRRICVSIFCTNQTNRELYVCVLCAVLVRLVPDKRFSSEYKTPKTHHVAGDNAGDICAAEEGLATHCTDVVHPPAKFFVNFSKSFHRQMSHRMPALLLQTSRSKARVVARSGAKTQLSLTHPGEMFFKNIKLNFYLY